MQYLINILKYNGVKYSISDYAGCKSILIKNNGYQLEIYIDDKGYYVSDLQKIPYTWGIMGSTTLDEIFEDLRKYLNINITDLQLTLF